MKQLSLFLLFLPVAAYGQRLDDIVVSAAEVPVSGSDGGLLMWTMGELMVEYYANGPALDQGFLQLRLLASSAGEAEGETFFNWNLSIWPNPVSREILNLKSGAHLRITLFDSLGRPIKSTYCPGETISLDLSACPAGSYWLYAMDEEGRSRAFQVQKF